MHRSALGAFWLLNYVMTEGYEEVLMHLLALGAF